jgi:Pro-kumamolisin, activation domain/Fibronectin type III domain/PQQ-like domain
MKTRAFGQLVLGRHREGLLATVRRTIALLLGVGMLAANIVPAQAAAPRGVTLAPSDVTPGLQRATRLRPTDPNRQLTIEVSLALRNQAQLESFIARVSSRKSPDYGRYLTPAQFAAAYAPTQTQVQQVVDHLRTHGLAVTSVSTNRTLVDATGTVAAVEAAFGVSISDWHDPNQNGDFFGNEGNPTLPASLASFVVGIAGLNNHYQLQRLGSSPHVPPGGGPAGGYTPTDLKTAYDVSPLASAGYNGTGQGLGLFELDGFHQANITTYDTNYGLGSPAPTVVTVDGGSGPLGMGEVEVELDIEVMHALAPATPITVWEGPNTFVGANDIFNAMVTSNTTKSNSTSWGTCEANVTPTEMMTLDNIFAQGAAQGQSFYAASGDSGAFDCGTSALAVDWPANDPYITGTGGTRLTVSAGSTYSSEAAWSQPGHGSGGGLSTFWAQPSWQSGPGVSNSFSTGKRQVPDVSLDADPATGYSVYLTYLGTTGWNVIGGTSAAAPAWAAFTAVYNQFAAANGKPNLGFANPTLYTTASNSQPHPAFHDVTTGNNLFYSATTGWDYATGWGSYDAYNLARDLAVSTDWPTYHRSNIRDGNDQSAGAFGTVGQNWISPKLDGHVYAEPLVVGNQVIVATENNSIYSLDATTGIPTWTQPANFGAPVIPANPPFLCWNISPIGITGTPVVDTVAGVVYAVAFVQPDTYELVGVNLSNGAQTFTPIPISPTGFDPTRQQQRGALTLSHGYVNVAFGGYAGDCGSYHGWLIGVKADGTSTTLRIFQDQAQAVCASAPSPNQAALWAPSGASADASGNLYVASGNGSSLTTYDCGETVFKLSPTLGYLDSWAPSVWAALNSTDSDVGSLGPTLVGASNSLVFQSGKNGWGYLLNTSGLSSNSNHIGGEAFNAPVCKAAIASGSQTVAMDQVFGGVAYADPYIYVPCADGIQAVKLGTGPSFSIAWSSQTFHPAAPIVSGGLIWAVDTSSNVLLAIDQATGATRFVSGLLGGQTHFSTPAAGQGRVYLADGFGDVIRAFGPATVPGAPTGVSVSAGDASATVSWTAPASNGGSPITGYRVTPYIGTTAQIPTTFSTTATSQTVAGLTNGTAYTFTVAAINSVGIGPESAPSNAVTPLARYVAGVVGTDSGLWTLASGAAGFSSGGGGLLGAPAVVSIPQSSGAGLPIYIGTGTDHDLYVRSDTKGWQHLTTSPAFCIDNPAGVVIGSTLYVACQGSDHALWHAETAAPSGTNLPTISTGWQSLGGVLTVGPAVASVAGTPTYLVVGAANQVYSRTLAVGYTALVGWQCNGHPALATSGTTSYFGCHGTDGALWYATNTGSGWGPAQSLGGVLIDGPGIAAAGSGPIFFVEGTDHALYHRSLSAGWTKDGGGLQFGAAAAAL